jgi:hypothetical protein
VTFGKGNAAYHTASLDAGRTFTKPVKVAEVPKLALGMRRGPRIVASDKMLTITAISHADGNLRAWNSKDGGATWKQSLNVNDTPNSAGEGLHAMASDGQGHVFATWLDLRNKGTELWRAISADGGATWSANALVYKSPDGHICECCHPSAAMDAQGRVAVMWRNWLGGSRDMYAALSSDGGKSFADAQKLGSGTWKLTGCPMDGGAVAFGADGKPVTAWRRETTAFFAELGGDEQRLSDPGIQPLAVTMRGELSYLWQNGNDLILKKGDSKAAILARNAAFASAATLPDGRAVVVWESSANGAKTLLAEVLD